MKLSRLCCALAVILTSYTASSLKAEIQNVTVTWQAALCPDSCPNLLVREFNKISGVEKVDIQPGAGQLELKWKPDVPFSFSPINTAMRMVGPRLKVIRVSVKGRIHSSGDNFAIVSDRDGTTFNLVNRITPKPDQYFEQYNINTRSLPDDVKAELREKERNREVVIISGPLFQPERVLPLQLILEYMQKAEEPKKQGR